MSKLHQLTLKNQIIRSSFQSLTRANLFHTTKYTFEAKPTETTPTENEPSKIVSSAPAGTVLKGINFTKSQSDPIALKDEEYPSWLWKLLDPKPEITDIFSKVYQRKINREAIKSKNFLKKK